MGYKGGDELMNEGRRRKLGPLGVAGVAVIGLLWWGPNPAFAFDDIDRLLIGVMMHRRASGWYHSTELSHALRADILIHEQSERAVTGLDHFAIAFT